MVLLYGLLVLPALAGAQDTLSAGDGPLLRKSSFIPIPIIFYTPETRFGAGAAALLAFRLRGQDEAQRPSQVQLGGAYTQEKQILLYLPFQFFSKKEIWNAYGELGYYRYVYKIFGTGNETLTDNEETYDANYPRLRLNVLRQLRPGLYAGLRYWFDDYHIAGVQAGGFLDQGLLTGSKGGIISGGGPLLVLDTRNNIFYPTAGWLAELGLFHNSTALGSDFNFTRLSLDAATYRRMKPGQVLALNAVLTSLYGEPPFQQLAFIGGPKKMRGYFEGRFRDRHLWLLQAEYRARLFWRLGGVVFGGIGSVAPALDEVFAQKIHATYGLGLRLRLTNRDPINLRLDVGMNEEGGVFPYLTVTEAF